MVGWSAKVGWSAADALGRLCRRAERGREPEEKKRACSGGALDAALAQGSLAAAARS